MLDFYIELLKKCGTFSSACKVYAHILANEDLTEQEKKMLSEVYEAHTAKMPYILDAGEN